MKSDDKPISDAELDRIVGQVVRKPKTKGGNRRIPEKTFQRVLELVGDGRSLNAAALEAGLSGFRPIKAKAERDPAYAERLAEAVEANTQGLEDEARRRAVNGSDLLLIFLLKSRRPNVYRDNVRHEHEGRVDLRLQVAAEEFERRFADRAERVRAIEATGLRDS